MPVRVGGTLWQREEVSENELVWYQMASEFTAVQMSTLNPKFYMNCVYHISPFPELKCHFPEMESSGA